MRIRKKTYGFDDLLIVPKFTAVESRGLVSLRTRLAPALELEIPMISSNMDTITESRMARAMHKSGGIGIIHRYLTPQRRKEELAAIADLPFRAMAVGVTKEELTVAKELLKAGANILCLDIAHGHSSMMERALGELKAFAQGLPTSQFGPLSQLVLIAGNVAAPEGAQALEKWGADVLKVGIGPGSMCTTRIVTGAGYGQLTAISDCAQAAKIPVIADGGVRNSGDATKALAAGASAVMVGKLLAGTDEVPSWALDSGTYRGMASAEAQGGHYGYDFKDRHPEGVATRVSVKGPVDGILRPFCGGIRSGYSYAGALNLAELQKNVEFVECAPGVVVESLPHGLAPEYGREVKRV